MVTIQTANETLTKKLAQPEAIAPRGPERHRQ